MKPVAPVQQQLLIQQDSHASHPRHWARAFLVATCVIASLCLCSCGPLANMVTGEQVAVMKKATRTYSDRVEVFEWQRDWQGNCLAISSPSGFEDQSISFVCDQNGYVTKTDYDKDADATESITVNNTFDVSGRLASSTALLPSGESVMASYAYYGETNRISSISYVGFDVLDAATAMNLSYIQQFPDATAAKSATQTKVNYSEDGQRASFELNGATTSLSTPTRESRAGQTIDNDGDNPSVVSTYDGSGRVVQQVLDWSDPSYSSFGYTAEYEYEQVLMPSPAVAMFARLY